jgi:c-di-GMP-binding flagellar brake protein YcgR
MSQAVATELREHRRHAPTILRAEIERDSVRREGYLMNVSLGGAFLTVENPPPPDSTLAVHVLFPWGMGETRLDARAVWLQTDERGQAIGAGVSFLEISDDARQKLSSYLERFVELAAEITS